ncbi:unnamed protein product [Penicillium manginii]
MDEFRTYYTYYIQKHPGLDDESLFSSLHGHNEATVSKPEQSKLYKDRKCPCGFRKTQHKAWSCWLIDKDEPKRPDSFKIPKELLSISANGSYERYSFTSVLPDDDDDEPPALRHAFAAARSV